MLRDNDISEVPKTIYRCAKLKTLHLQVNQINVLPPELSMYTRSLSLTHTPTHPQIHTCSSSSILIVLNCISSFLPTIFLVYVARLDFLGEKCTFYIHDNPLIHALDEKLQTSQASVVKLLFEYMRTEEYRE